MSLGGVHVSDGEDAQGLIAVLRSIACADERVNEER
jgi:hypothetical protein